MRAPSRGFTLLEVLAAVALLGILYTVLADSATRGLRGEGESRRRLEASLLADRLLAEIESGLAAGTAPPVGVSEDEEDPYAIRTEVSSYELPVPAPDEDEARNPGDATLFPDARGGGEPPVRRIDVVVSWLEGASERSVVRTTFGLDLEAAAGALEAIAPAPVDVP